jgi:hypothetical protein
LKGSVTRDRKPKGWIVEQGCQPLLIDFHSKNQCWQNAKSQSNDRGRQGGCRIACNAKQDQPEDKIGLDRNDGSQGKAGKLVIASFGKYPYTDCQN